MNNKPIAIAAAFAGLLACATPSFAAPVTLTFEGTNGFSFVSEYYNGGTDIPGTSSQTAASGPNYGVSFGLDAMTVINDGTGLGPNGEYFTNAPSATVMAPVGSSASLMATGQSSFIDSLSFSYSANQAFTLNLLDAGDNILASFDLAATNGSCTDLTYCVWTQASLDFSGAARSISFGGGYDLVNGTIAAFDNITVNAVPVPAAGWLLASGLLMLGRMRRKQTA
jgi:hypothetical protein